MSALIKLPLTSTHVRSFVRRNSRQTATQSHAHRAYWPQFGLQSKEGELDDQRIFGRNVPCYLEIGFGSGQSLLLLAKQNLDKNFIGVETHRPGIGALLHGMQMNELDNIRIYEEDVVVVFEKSIKAQSLDGINIFFPDPWPKRRHHPRRLIQIDFVQKLVDALKLQGSLHLATDWYDYALHMLRVFAQESRLQNLAGVDQFAERSIFRPLVTKFEARAIREGRQIWELQFAKKRVK